MDPALLEAIGLTEGEAKVYLALLRLGPTKTGPLTKESGVSASKVYKVLDRLMVKGLAGHVTRGKIKFFTAMAPEQVVAYMEEREAELKAKKEKVCKLLPQLRIEQQLAEQRSNATVFDGFKAVTNIFRSIIDELRPRERYCVLGATYGDVPGLQPFFQQHHVRRTEKNIKLTMLANSDVRGKLVESSMRNSEIRFLPPQLSTPMEIVLYNDKAFIVIWMKSPVGFLIENDEAVKSFQKYFDSFWQIAEK